MKPSPHAALFVPADSERKIAKALESGAGTVILDLEDGVAAEAKAAARVLLPASLGGRPQSVRLVIRCNAVGTTDFAADAALLPFLPVDGVMLPKAERATDIATLAEAMPEGEIVPLVETALGVLRLEEIATSSPRVRQVAFGSVDFGLDLGTGWTPEGDERRHAMGHIALVSRALGLLPPMDAVYPVLDDAEAFRRDAALGRRLGFGPKMVIHPRQAEWLADLFAPSEAELAWCRLAISAYEAAGAAGSLRVEGRLVDRPVYLQARQLLGINP